MACFQLDLDSDDSKEDDQDSGLIMKNCSSSDDSSSISNVSSPSSLLLQEEDRATPLASIDNFFNFNDPKMTSSTNNNNNNSNRKVGGRLINKRQRFKAHCQFDESYYLTGKTLGRGAYASVEACIHKRTRQEYAVKMIEKLPHHSRFRIIKEIELFNLCAGHPNIVQLVEYFEEDDKFYLVFEIMRGGPLLSHIQRRGYFTENEASLVVKDIANALKFLHDRGVAHRDLKPDNILCTNPYTVSPVKLCDLDLASKNTILNSSVIGANIMRHEITTPELQSPVGSAEFMAPEVVDAFVGESLSYDKRCDLWSLGVILYIMLCGYPPFYGECSRPNCGWNEGLACQDCQESLFAKIQTGRYDFPSQDWQFVSSDAKNLISHLLERDVKRRYDVDDVLNHPFVAHGAPETPLQTANMLSRIDSKRDLAENFAAVDRIKLHDDVGDTATTTPNNNEANNNNASGVVVFRLGQSSKMKKSTTTLLVVQPHRTTNNENQLAKTPSMTNSRPAFSLASCSASERRWRGRRGSSTVLEPSNGADSPQNVDVVVRV